MKTKFIAALVLVGLCYWSVPVASAMQPKASTAEQPARHRAARMHDHSCCPGVHAEFVPPIFVNPTPAEIPCDQHPCCVKQGPENSAAVSAATTIPRPEVEGLVSAIPDAAKSIRAATKASGNDSYPSYSARTTVLRI